MSTATFAVQPSSWVKFDERGCDWATDINNAYNIARIWKEQYGEDCTIWRVPFGGQPMAWVSSKNFPMDS
jgi:hypothetical protein